MPETSVVATDKTSVPLVPTNIDTTQSSADTIDISNVPVDNSSVQSVSPSGISVEPASVSDRVSDSVSNKIVEVNDKLTEYQDIASAGNDMFADFMSQLPYFMVATAVFLLFWVLSIVFKWLVTRLLTRSASHRNLIKVFQRLGGAIILFVGFMVAMVIAIPSFTPAKLISGLGIGSVAIGFAFKDIFQNLLSGILLLLSEPFRIGDQIVSGDYEGTVEDIQVRATKIRTYDGRQVVIPNSHLYTSAVTVNTAFRRRRLEVMVGIEYSQDIRAAQDVILQAIKGSKTVSKLAEPSVIATEFADSSINLIARWYVEDGTQANKNTSMNEMIISIKEHFDKANIGIPYPIRTLDFSDGSAKALIKQALTAKDKSALALSDNNADNTKPSSLQK